MKTNVKLHYPANSDFKFEVKLVRLNLDQEMEKDLQNKGFLIKEPQKLQKNLKSPDSIYSERYMKTLDDDDAFSNRYSCSCGATTGLEYANMTCKECNTKVEYIGDDFDIFGWIKIKEPYCIIHPNIYRSLDVYFNKSLASILEPDIDYDINGNPMTAYDKKIYKSKLKSKYRNKKYQNADQTYSGIGMIEFKKRFDEILEYFHTKNKKKKLDYYEDILKNKDKIFIHGIPVYTTAMRPFKLEGGNFTFSDVNAIFNIMAKLAAYINKDNLKIYNLDKYRNNLLWDLQEKYNKLYDEIVSILSSKKGNLRQLIGGRCNFTARSIITPDPKLRIDEVKIPYHALVELLQQSIINTLVKTQNITYAQAYTIWYKAQIERSQRVYDIIDNFIRIHNGINLIVNRNPTLGFGSIIAMRCIGINDTFTMSMPIQILPPLNADFDGDCLNLLYIPNNEFWEEFNKSFNPRNGMMISRNDGKFNDMVNVFKDILITANGLINLSRDKYSKEELEEIYNLKKCS